MRPPRLVLALALAYSLALGSTFLRAQDEEGITWIFHYEGDALPGPDWAVEGEPKASLDPEGLRLVDNSDGVAHYRRSWEAEPDQHNEAGTGSPFHGPKAIRFSYLWGTFSQE